LSKLLKKCRPVETGRVCTRVWICVYESFFIKYNQVFHQPQSWGNCYYK